MPSHPAPVPDRRLLLPHEPDPVVLVNETGRAPFVLICEHAGNRIPERLGTMGLSEEDRRRHIAWDIGAEAVARHLSRRLDAPLFLQRYSRLVCDCNRHPQAPDFIAAVSEGTPIPGNADVPPSEARRRTDEIHRVFHDRIAAFLDRRTAAGRESIVVSVHSFTPVFEGIARPWNVGVLYNRDPVFARRTLDCLHAEAGLEVGDNEPYVMSDETDYTIPVHGERRGLACVEFEIRNDQIRDPRGQMLWAERLARVVCEAAAGL
ncbi:MAG: N-formylglutamate amidohydrolase [Alphaproteobacteria bacterium]|nr:MAG: N-formylglutamate amidohydrolase [Alphaproteobacteria bacterium]